MNEQKSKSKRRTTSPAAEAKSRRLESSEKSSGQKSDSLKKSSEKSSSPKSKESVAKQPYKTKWEPTTSSDASFQVCPPKKEEALQPSTPPVRFKDLLDNREKIVDHLFRTVTGTALEEIIPDYLKVHVNENLIFRIVFLKLRYESFTGYITNHHTGRITNLIKIRYESSINYVTEHHTSYVDDS
ncbi:hypothetical protein CEXT_663441 [Caerostris extrusa]|uniref:Uncharacterized protein n=1 Tax=Caerostris extrusa TaxID=172846 RepID=A0AAV4RUY9_CAEEX|nr:hypothetical protein CEXT_663441 [Caerostris extrusa]